MGALLGDHLTLPTLDDVLKNFAARGDIVDQLAHDRYSRLDDEARMILDAIAVFRTPTSREPIDWVVSPLIPGIDAGRALMSEPVRKRFPSISALRLYELHPLDADIAYAALPAETSFGRRILERRVAAWYHTKLNTAPWHAVNDVANHRRAFEHLFRAGDFDACSFILDEISEFLVYQGSNREMLALHLALRDHLQDDRAKLAHLVGYGLALEIGGPLEDAVQPLSQAVELAERASDDRQLQRALFCLGDVLRDLRQLHEAAEVLKRAAAIARKVGNTALQAHSLLQLSLTLTYLGQVAGALEIVDQLDQLCATDNNPLLSAQASNARSAVYIVMQKWDYAIDAADQAIGGYEESGIPEALGYARNGKGLALLALDRVEEAVTIFEHYVLTA